MGYEVPLILGRYLHKQGIEGLFGYVQTGYVPFVFLDDRTAISC